MADGVDVISVASHRLRLAPVYLEAYFQRCSLHVCCLFLHLLVAVGEKSKVIPEVEVIQVTL